LIIDASCRIVDVYDFSCIGSIVEEWTLKFSSAYWWFLRVYFLSDWFHRVPAGYGAG